MSKPPTASKTTGKGVFNISGYIDHIDSLQVENRTLTAFITAITEDLMGSSYAELSSKDKILLLQVLGRLKFNNESLVTKFLADTTKNSILKRHMQAQQLRAAKNAIQEEKKNTVSANSESMELARQIKDMLMGGGGKPKEEPNEDVDGLTGDGVVIDL